MNKVEQQVRDFIAQNFVMAEAADGKMKHLSVSETKKKKDGNPKMAAKKPQQQKKKVSAMGMNMTSGEGLTELRLKARL